MSKTSSSNSGISDVSQVQSKLKSDDSLEKYQSLIQHMDRGFCIAEIILDENRNPVDYRFIEVNDAFEDQSGLLNPVGKTARQLVPDLEDRWIQIYGNVALTGKSIKFTEGSEAMGRWFEVNSFRIGDQNSLKIAILFSDITKLKKAETTEEALRISEGRFAAAVEAIVGIIWTNNADGQMVGTQPGWSKLTGQTYAEYQGFGWAKAVHPEDALPTVEAWKMAVNLQKNFEFEHRLKTASGEWRRFFVKAVPLKDPDGTIREWVGMHADITEQHQAKEAIRASEGRFQNLVMDASAAIIVLTGESMKVEIVNEAYSQLINLKPSDLLGRPLFDVIPDAQGFYQPILEKVRQTGEPQYLYESPYSVVTNGMKAEGFLNIVCQPYRSINGRILGVMAIMQDITGTVLVKKALEASELKFRSLIEEAPIATCLYMGRDLKIEVANEKMLHIWNKDRTVIGKPYHEVMPELKDQHFFDLLDEVFTTGRTYEAKGAPAVFQVNGEPRTSYFDFTFKPLFDADGKVYSIMNMAADVTEQVKAVQTLQESESRFRNLSERLEDEVAIRTSQLTQSNEDLQQFAHVASHDLKEPVRKIKTFVGRLEQEAGSKLDERCLSYVIKIQQSTDRMIAMIDGVLAYSSFSSEAIQTERVDLNDIVLNIRNDLDLLIQEKQIEINFRKLPVIEGARVLLYQLFYNIITNSIKFARQDQKSRVTVECNDIVFNGGKGIQIQIRDNGIGFDPKYSKSIFETFTRLNPKDKFEGTGLGLALCKKIVERHNGTIEAHGERNVGAMFTINLPFNG